MTTYVVAAEYLDLVKPVAGSAIRDDECLVALCKVRM